MKSLQSGRGEILTLSILFIIIFGLIAARTMVSIAKPSDGERAGTLAKFSQKGWFVKTWEGELRVEGSVAEPWNFSCDDPALSQILLESVGKKMKLGYHQGFVFFTSGETSYLAKSVVLLE